jgi:hypothetical protein
MNIFWIVSIIVVVLGAIGFLRSLPDILRYRRMKKM